MNDFKLIVNWFGTLLSDSAFYFFLIGALYFSTMTIKAENPTDIIRFGFCGIITAILSLAILRKNN